jgi:competence protein ComEA
MLDMDRKQAVVFSVMAAIILALAGIILIREIDMSRDSEIKPVDENSYENYYKDDYLKDSINDEEDENLKEEHAKIKVYITGQVRNPGVVEVDEGSRLQDVVERAGGLLEGADLLRVNLAIKVKDEGMYVIPKEGEQMEEGYISPTTQTDNGKVNINTADESQLQTLPRIGPVLARSIIEYREENGPFQKIEDIKNVSGIGDKTFEGLKDLIKVE